MANKAETIYGTVRLIDDPTYDMVLEQPDGVHLALGALVEVEKWKNKRVRITIEDMDAEN